MLDMINDHWASLALVIPAGLLWAYLHRKGIRKKLASERVEGFRSMGWKIHTQDGVYFAVGKTAGSWKAVNLETGAYYVAESEETAEAEMRLHMLK